jgi:diphthamide synthase subunit DPH2
MVLVGCARVAAIDGDRVTGTLLRRSEMMLAKRAVD